jgi:hypothetical protein
MMARCARSYMMRLQLNANVMRSATWENCMRRYEQVSGSLFAVIALAQLTRSILGLPAQVGSLAIPLWWSSVAFLVAGSLAVWAFRASRGAA